MIDDYSTLTREIVIYICIAARTLRYGVRNRIPEAMPLAPCRMCTGVQHRDCGDPTWVTVVLHASTVVPSCRPAYPTLVNETLITYRVFGVIRHSGLYTARTLMRRNHRMARR